MTIVAAYTDGTRTWIGSDCASVRGSTVVIDPAGKWTVYAGWGIALAGAHRYANAIDARRERLFGKVRGPFDLTLRLAELFRECGGQPHGDNEDRLDCWGASGIIATAGQIWDLDETLAIMPWPEHRLLANGSGADFALGAAWAMDRIKVMEPEDRVRHAIEAACALDNTCDGLWLKEIS